MKNQKMLSVRLEQELIRKLKILAATLERPVANLIDEAARDLMEKYKSKGQ